MLIINRSVVKLEANSDVTTIIYILAIWKDGYHKNLKIEEGGGYDGLGMYMYSSGSLFSLNMASFWLGM